jgi:hypothetical protein
MGAGRSADLLLCAQTGRRVFTPRLPNPHPDRGHQIAA